MTRVLIFSTAYFPHVGGAEIAIKEITNRVPDTQFELICARLDKNLAARERVGGIDVHRVGPGIAFVDKLWLPFGGALLARRLNRTAPFDAYWAMMVTYASGAAYIANLLRPSVPIVLTLQEGDSEARLRFRWFGLIDLSWRLALKRTASLTAISTYLIKRAHRLGYRAEAVLVPNGVDMRRFTQSYSEQALEELKTTLGKKMGDVFLITTSRLVRKNAVDDVIRALPSIPENVKFLVLGTGALESRLRKLVAQKRLGERVRFLGHVDHAQMPKYLSVSDIFIRASRSEGMGNSFVEAMAAGLPVIATQEGGIADFLFDEKRNPGKPVTGWAVDRDAPKQIAEAVEDIMAHSEKVRAVVATAKALVIAKYDWDLIARDMQEKVFDPLFTKRG